MFIHWVTHKRKRDKLICNIIRKIKKKYILCEPAHQNIIVFLLLVCFFYKHKNLFAVADELCVWLVFFFVLFLFILRKQILLTYGKKKK